jgi:long-chain acyl-CoA synthetase
MKKIKNIGSGLIKKGLTPDNSTFVGVYAQNSVQWVLSEYACYFYSMVIVPLYDTLGPEACTYIVNQAEISHVICDNEEKVKALLDQQHLTPTLRCIVHMQPVSDETRRKAAEKKIDLITFDDLEKLGAANPHEFVYPKPSELATICYTSGTTGNPKGVMLTHENVVSDVCTTGIQLGDFKPTSDDVMISFLPLAHMLERICETTIYLEGGSCGFYQGDIKLLGDDMVTLKPTVAPVVPRLFNRIYDKVMAMSSGSAIKRTLLKMAISSKERELNKGIIRNTSIWDKLVFKKVRDGMGGRLRLVVVGSAPLAGNVLSFMRCALGCAVLEGYGQTESAAPATLTILGDNNVEHVGPPLPCCSIKLVDVPEMQYYAHDNKGEICIKGYNVFKGYFKDPEKTKETIDDEGWLHTGDIGMWLPNGTLKIVDRKKHIFKLAQGEYIAPEKIENIYIRGQFVSQIFVHGESLKSCLIAIVVPDMEVVSKWQNQQNLGKLTCAELCQNQTFKKAVLDDLNALGKKAGLKSFEQVKDIYLSPEPFSLENNLITPTMKTKRPECKKFFMPQIEAMYRTLA